LNGPHWTASKRAVAAVILGALMATGTSPGTGPLTRADVGPKRIQPVIGIRSFALPTTNLKVAAYRSYVVNEGGPDRLCRHSHGQITSCVIQIWGGNVGRIWKPVLLKQFRTIWDPQGLIVSAHWIVWPAAPWGRSYAWRIYALNRSTRRLYVVDSSDKEGVPRGPFLFPQGSLYGDTIGYSYTTCHAACDRSGYGPTFVATMRLPDGPKKIQVSSQTAGCPVGAADLWGKTLVWVESFCEGPHSDEIFVKDLATGRARRLTNGRNTFAPVTNGRFVAWRYHDAPHVGPNYVWVYDTRTGRRFRASRVIGPWHKGCRRKNVDTCVYEWGPLMNSRVVAFSSAGPQPRGGVHAPFFLDLWTGREYGFPRGQGGTPEPSVGPRLIWSECSPPGSFPCRRPRLFTAIAP